jgi:hypothetical protein
MHFAFTPQLASGTIPGAVARGSHFYSWSRMSDTLRSLWRIQFTGGAVTNAKHKNVWALLSRMLLDLSLDLETGGEDLPEALDIGALLVIILRRRDLGCEVDHDALIATSLQLAANRARTVVEKLRMDHPPVYDAWLKEDARLTYWIENKCDLDAEEKRRLSELGS